MQTGLQAINTPLLLLRGSVPGAYSETSSSGLSTSRVEAPKVITAFPQGTFMACLQRPGLQQVLNQIQLFPITPEVSHHLVTEGDVERASALYLLHDVNLIIENYLVQHLHPPVQTIECLGQSTDGLSRPDIKYVVNGVVVLIVEFKNTCVYPKLSVCAK